jgi:hypothetical protein
MREYIKRHLEPRPASPKAPQETAAEYAERRKKLYPESLRREFAPGMKFGESGTESIELETGGTLTFSYEPVPKAVIEEYEKYWFSMPNMGQHLLKFRKLTDFTIQTSAGRKIRLSDFPVRNALFAPDMPLDGHSSADPVKRDVFLSGPPTTPAALLALFHELGHCERVSHMNKQEQKEYLGMRKRFAWQAGNHPILSRERREEKFEEAVEEVLRDERGAWAVALSKLRPFLPLLGISREDALKDIHEISLASYSDAVRERLAREPRLGKLIESLSQKWFGDGSSITPADSAKHA